MATKKLDLIEAVADALAHRYGVEVLDAETFQARIVTVLEQYIGGHMHMRELEAQGVVKTIEKRVEPENPYG